MADTADEASRERWRLHVEKQLRLAGVPIAKLSTGQTRISGKHCTVTVYDLTHVGRDQLEVLCG